MDYNDADWPLYQRYRCGDCMCCWEDDCDRSPDSGCPTDSLGDFTCPCTGE